MKTDYLTIVFGRNENDSIRKVLDSLLAQTIPPAKINIVDDGSTDGMYETIQEYAKLHTGLIQVFRFDPHPSDFSRLPMLWNTGMERSYSFHLIMPSDASLVPNYAEFLLTEFDKNPNLAIASGDWGYMQSIAPHGGGRFVRQEFFNRYYPNGYPRILGYESEILERASLEGCDLLCSPKVEILHYAELGHSHNFKEFGYGMKCLGYYPPYAFARVLWDFFYNKQVGKRGALNILKYYILFTPAKEGYYSKFPEDIRRAVKEKQKRMLQGTLTTLIIKLFQRAGFRHTGLLTKIHNLKISWSVKLNNG